MPDISYSIRIVDENGNGIPDEGVTVFYLTCFNDGFTDKDGWVTFEKNNFMLDYADAKVWVRGECLGEILACDGNTFSFTYNLGDELEE